MVRDTTEGKASFLNVLFGPMLARWAEHTTKGRTKYPDVAPGVPNWTLAQGVEEYLRAKDSAFRHSIQWLRGDRDEDHAAAVIFNINLAEYVLERCPEIRPSLGAVPSFLPDEPCTPDCTACSDAGCCQELVSGLPNPHADEVKAAFRATFPPPKTKIQMSLSDPWAGTLGFSSCPSEPCDCLDDVPLKRGDRVVIVGDSSFKGDHGQVLGIDRVARGFVYDLTVLIDGRDEATPFDRADVRRVG